MPRRADPPEPDNTGRDLHFGHRGQRVVLARRPRGTDITTMVLLLLSLPGLLLSLAVILLLSAGLDALVGLPFWIPPLLWLLSGALVFHRGTEEAIAGYFFRLRRPKDEFPRLDRIWREVAAKAGVDHQAYELWVEKDDTLNASAGACHVIAVTTGALDRTRKDGFTDAELAAVLAHELGHHTWGHSWSLLLSRWYAAPGQLTARLVRAGVLLAFAYASAYSVLAATLLAGILAWIAYTTITFLYGLPLLLPLIPYLLAAIGRASELRADQHAAVLGFAPPLARALEKMEAEESPERRRSAAHGRRGAAHGVLDRLLATHPDTAQRVHRLRPYLRPAR